MDFLIPTLYAAFFIFLIWKLPLFRIEGLSRPGLIFFFTLKIAAGIGLSLIYTYHYTYRNTSDAFRYFDDAGIMYSAIHNSPMDYLRMLTGIGDDAPHLNQYYDKMLRWSRGYGDYLFNDNRTIIRFNAFLYLFSQGYYHVHTVFMCFISFCGLTAIYKTFSEHLGAKRLLMAAVFLFPSVLFWSSGVLKEGIIMFALGLTVYHFHCLAYKSGGRRSIFWFLFSLGILMLLKYYILFALAPSLLAGWWMARGGDRNAMLRYFLVFIFGAVAVISTRWLPDQYNVLRTLSVKQADFVNLARGGIYLTSDKYLIYVRAEEREQVISLGTDSTFKIKQGSHYDYWSVNDVSRKMEMKNYQDTTTYKLAWDFPPAGSRIEIKPLSPGPKSFLKAAPGALFNTLFRPHLLEANSVFMLIAAFENLLLLLLLLLALLFPAKNVNKALIYFCLSFVLLLFLLIGWVTPVLGAIVRYKVPGLPFLLIALLMMIDWDRLVAKFPIFAFIHKRS